MLLDICGLYTLRALFILVGKILNSMGNTEQLFNRLEETVKSLGIKLNSPATAEDLKNLELAINQKLPQDLYDFYSYCNGFETNDVLFRVIPIGEILSYIHELTTSFYFAEYMVYSDDWKIKLHDKKHYRITNDNHKSVAPLTLTTSVIEFLERYLTGGGVFGDNGLYKWFDEVQVNSKNITK
jgi:hypothetical protein